MATNFGISQLRSKFDDWRQSRTDEDNDDEGIDEADASQSSRFPYLVSNDPKEAMDLSILIENLVIPKLIAERDNQSIRLGEQAIAENVGTDRRRPITQQDVHAFTALTIDAEASKLLDFVDNCLATGSSVESVYVELLAPAARILGKNWEDDTGDFVDVTMGLWRIQEVLRELALRIPPTSSSGHGQRSALFSTMPGEQHSLGTLMVAECFQRAGWETDVLMEPSQSELTGKFADRDYDLIGLTLSNDCPTGTISGLINAIRAVSKNPKVCVMVGGRFINENPGIADECGADATAVDALSAVNLADSLVPAMAPELVLPDLLA